jgi:hypothetical protein
MTRSRINADQARTESLNVVPHIIPDVLHPAVAGKLLDGSTAHDSTYGVAQSDGRMYYYTDIKGSKPIKDPRIGSHFGSQRFKISSLQLLDQETATQGKDVYSIDGREWMRAVGTNITGNDARGSHILFKNGGAAADGTFIEITGYFNKMNYLAFNEASRMGLDYYVNGGSATQTNDTQFSAVTSPLDGRYVNAQSLHSINIGTISAPTINTVKIFNNTTTAAAHHQVSGIELIAQDTTSTANKSKIQIPSQNVVSYGKKFTVAETKHYNPFAYKTDGSTVWASGAHNGTAWPIGTGSSANIDTATSLGLAAWVSTNYYKPYNGGRVVKWVASDGTIKTSVNMMPPNAKSIGNSSSLTNATAKANASIANNTYLPTFESGAIDHSLAEVAKTFHVREFGNGSANGNASYPDASTLSGTADIAYVMDDGLTSCSADDFNGDPTTSKECILRSGASDVIFYTFIGTGLSLHIEAPEGTDQILQICQNLPYGTHVFKYLANASNANHMDLTVDGVAVSTAYNPSDTPLLKEVTFHQPKMPPIPEDAVVIADYMLMADFVVKTGAADGGAGKISKGIRFLNTTRDTFYDGAGMLLSLDPASVGFLGIYQYGNDTSALVSKIPSFCTLATKWTFTPTDRRQAFKINGSTVDVTASEGGHGAYYHPTAATTLGNNIWSTEGVQIGDDTSAGTTQTQGWEFASPIHTSSHYQTFETPYLHELVGGDRNMEQTNLVVTPDGKTWDEVSRDSSYIGKGCLSCTTDTSHADAFVIFDNWRGNELAGRHYFNKDFAIRQDRVICLKDGQYTITAQSIFVSAHTTAGIYVNGVLLLQGFAFSITNHTGVLSLTLEKGDYVQIKGRWRPDDAYTNFRIDRI